MEVCKLIVKLIILRFHCALISERIEKSVIRSSAFAETDYVSLVELMKYTPLFDSTLLCDLGFLNPEMMVLPKENISRRRPFHFICFAPQAAIQTAMTSGEAVKSEYYSAGMPPKSCGEGRQH